MRVQMRQLGAQDRGLDFIQARIYANFVRDVMGPPAILPQGGHPCGQHCVVRRQHAAIAQRAEILRWIQAERAHLADRAKPLAMQCGAVRLGAILDQRHAMGAAEWQYGIKIGGLAVKMHGNHRPNRRQAGGRMAQHFRQFGRVQRVMDGVDIEQQRRGTGHLDGRDRGDGGVGHGDHGRTRPDAQAPQCQRQRIGAVGAADSRLGPEKLGELRLEPPPLLAQDVPAGVKRAGDCRVYFRF